MSEWVISIPADNLEERWQPIAVCLTLENLRCLISSLVSGNCNGPSIIRVEKRSHIDVPK